MNFINLVSTILMSKSNELFIIDFNRNPNRDFKVLNFSKLCKVTCPNLKPHFVKIDKARTILLT